MKRYPFVLVAVVVLLLGACSLPTIGQGETRAAGPTITLNMAPVATYGDGSTSTADSSSWADANEGSRAGTATPTNTASPTTDVNATLPGPAPSPVSRVAPSKGNALETHELGPEDITPAACVGGACAPPR